MNSWPSVSPISSRHDLITTPSRPLDCGISWSSVPEFAPILGSIWGLSLPRTLTEYAILNKGPQGAVFSLFCRKESFRSRSRRNPRFFCWLQVIYLLDCLLPYRVLRTATMPPLSI